MISSNEKRRHWGAGAEKQKDQNQAAPSRGTYAYNAIHRLFSRDDILATTIADITVTTTDPIPSFLGCGGVIHQRKEGAHEIKMGGEGNGGDEALQKANKIQKRVG
jgi:hypothetical protein